MAKKLFVGSLDYNVDDNELGKLFSEVGTVDSAVVIKDKMSGRSRGFGFVEMSNDDEANKAVETLNGRTLSGREITVSEARPQAPRQDRGGFRRDDRRY